jgi:alkylation response protein AidB-like acyl-CoA dehydrogenase
VRFALTDEEIEAGETLRKMLASLARDSDEVLSRLDEFGAFDPALIAVTHEEIGYAGVAVSIELEAESASLAAAAQLVGLGQRMLDMTVGYVKEREQFGVPIGSFQAVKHHLANALKELAFARPAVHRAAWSMANDAPTVERDVSMAKAMASDAASFAGRQALQCHGAIGYTVEYDLHIYLKRTWELARSFGDAAWHRERIAKEVLDE